MTYNFYRAATWDDVNFVSDNMRTEDRDECVAGGLTPHDALSKSFQNCNLAYSLVRPVDFVPAAILGVSESPISKRLGILWMLGTEDIAKYKITFLRRCKPFLNILYDEANKEGFYNYTYSKNTLHHDWLHWLGFKFLRSIHLPPHGETFLEFVSIRKT